MVLGVNRPAQDTLVRRAVIQAAGTREISTTDKKFNRAQSKYGMDEAHP